MQKREMTLEGCRIFYPNFAGRATDYTAEGDRYFSVVIPEEIAQYLEQNGLPFRRLKPRPDDDPNEPTTAIIKVKIGGIYFPDVMTLVSNGGYVSHTPETIGQLDRIQYQRSGMSRVRFDNLDIVTKAPDGVYPFMNIDLKVKLSYIQKFKRYTWYLEWMRAWVESDYLDEKYAKLGIY